MKCKNTTVSEEFKSSIVARGKILNITFQQNSQHVLLRRLWKVVSTTENTLINYNFNRSNARINYM